MARARALQTTDPELATALWTKVDHDIVDQAPWLPFENPGFYSLLSERAGNYVYHPEWGVLIDQLWVH
jgi:peptide/nickel transport system substrate-binding protein